MLTDAAAIGVSLVALGLPARPTREQTTIDFKRAGILSAQFSA
jgi:Co/Zn/Cd efflux system component